jgi:glycerophosphoryl diester phosphodiesterase
LTTKTHEHIVRMLPRLRGRVRPLVAFSLVSKLVAVLVVGPVSAALLRLFLQQWGRCSVGNFELASFLLSPIGAAASVTLGTIGVAAIYVELAGLLLLLADEHPSIRRTLGHLVRRLRSLCVLARHQVAWYVLLALPFLVAACSVLFWLWSGKDVNGLIVLRPPVFWIGAGIAGGLSVVYGVLALRLFLRWLLSVPALLLSDDTSAKQAMAVSGEAGRGQTRRLLAGLVGWLLLQLVLGAVILVPLRILSDTLLDRIGTSLAVVLPVTGLVLVIHAIAAATLSVLATTTLAGLLLSYFAALRGVDLAEAKPRIAEAQARRSPSVRLVGLVVCGLLMVSVSTSAALLSALELRDDVEITAHRAGATVAPENTVAAIRRAIEDGADWAEIDVQLTADRAVVVIHDSDLRRVGSRPGRIGQMTLAEVQQVDVGNWFDPAFAGERVPTLDEVIAAAGDGIRLNIELKPHGEDEVNKLVGETLGSVRRAGILDRCRICSQSYAALGLAKELEPEVEVGFIAGAALGDLSALQVDFLMVSVRLTTRRLVDRARARGIAVHAWTVNDPDQLLRLLDRGVTNVITDDVAAMKARLAEIRELHPAARLLLRTRNLLAD